MSVDYSKPLPYTLQRFIFMTLDPVHIGTGGYRLGRVDMSIAREPGTNLPKIPGTSLSGAARNYAHLRMYGKPEDKETKKNGNGNTDNDPFHYTFGAANNSGGGKAGTVSIGDAHILFFPVASIKGPVWVTTPDILKDAQGIELNQNDIPGENGPVICSFDPKESLNLGWLLLEARSISKIQLPDTLEMIKNKIVIVSPKLFTQIVNSNLEVRTSVSINPETGAAEDGALFTYEALPRATWLWCDVIQDDYRNTFPKDAKVDNKLHFQTPLDVVRAGLELIEYLGVGGMGTRGFGRMKIVSPQKK